MVTSIGSGVPPGPPSAPSDGVWMARSTLIALAVLLIGLGWGIGYGVTVLLRPVPLVSVPPAATNGANPSAAATDSTALPPELELRYQLLKNQLDNAADNSKQLDRLVTLLLTLTSLYALALGLNSYFGLKQILDSGKEDLGKLRDFLGESRTEVREKLRDVDAKVGSAITNANSQLVEFRTELREKYPELANLHANLRDVLSGIRLMFQPGQNWTTQYGELTPEQREKFGVAEIRVAGLEVFRLGDLDSFRPDVRRAYQGLGRFYSSKYKDEKLRSYWERGSLYFDTAVQLDRAPAKPPAELLKDLGVHLTLIEQTMDDHVAAGGTATPAEMREAELLRSRAERAFRESLSENPLEPGALFGLGWVLLKKPDYQDAIAQYARVTANTSLTSGDRKKYLEDAYLNQACCYSLLATADTTDAAYATALERLEESKKVAIEYNRLSEWKVKTANEAASKDLRRLQAARAQELTTLLG
jgi:tetratricopeptide (TPR) repeat protein